MNHRAVDEDVYRFEGATSVETALRQSGGLAPGDDSSAESIRVAGRVLARRDAGGVVFADLHDQTGRLQLIAERDRGDACDALAAARIGDWIGVDGTATMSRRGEPSLRVAAITPLARTHRPFPDTWHGLADPDARYRQRHLDLWVSPDARRILRARSAIERQLRLTLWDLGFDEVTTPMLQPIHGGANARPFVTHHNALGINLFLRVAPELYLKRLVVGGCEQVFELGRVFRNEGISPRHNPEFTILEAYQAYSDLSDMIRLCERLIVDAAIAVGGAAAGFWDGREIDLAPPWRVAAMDELVEERTGAWLGLDRPEAEVRAAALELGVELDPRVGPGRILVEAFEQLVEPDLHDPVFVTDHPQETSPLARQHRERPGYTERFELFIGGVEMCNAFSELNDPVDQLDRFLEQARERDAGDDEAMVVDRDYVQALEAGLPPTGGLGIGVDRLVMLLTGARTIRDVVAFPTLRPLATATRVGGDASDR